MKSFITASIWSSLAWMSVLLSPADAADRPNVLVIVIDDLNDWVGCLGGHSQVQTPHIDRLAARGMLFTNAHAQATYCGPSRVAFLSGRYPQSTGCYDFERYSELESLRGHPPFPLHFRRHGYHTYGGGKIFHHGTGGGWAVKSWETVWKTGSDPRPPESIHWPEPVWDWGPFPERNAQLGDFQLAQTAAETLRQPHDRPFFIVTGFRRPHVPLHVPQEWFDLYPLDEIVLPEVRSDDLEDVPHPELGLESHAAPRHAELVERQLWRSLVQAYLASISFVDHCVGELMQGLDQGPNGNDTLVVLFSDHGFHLGEKQHWAKRTLWEETTRVPMLIVGPGIPANQRTANPVGLIDVYPTLCDLTGAPEPVGLEGRSLRPLLKDPQLNWAFPATTTFQPGDVSIRTKRWRYTVYPDGSEELYDHRNDPHEWRNLAQEVELEKTKQALAQRARKHRHSGSEPREH